MNTFHFSPDDPRLTAYALGELDPSEIPAIEAAIKDDPAAQAAVAQIRALAGDLTTALAKEPLPAPLPHKAESIARPVGKIVHFPYALVAGLAAACVAFLIVIQQPGVRERERNHLALVKAKAERSAEEKKSSEIAKNDAGVYEFDLQKNAEVARVASMPADREQAMAAKPAGTFDVAMPAPAAPTGTSESTVTFDRAEPATPAAKSPVVTSSAPASRPRLASAEKAARAEGALKRESERAATGGKGVAADGETIVLSEFAVAAPERRVATKLSMTEERSSAIGVVECSGKPVHGYVPVDSAGGATTWSYSSQYTFKDEAVAPAPAPRTAFNTEGYAYVQDNDFLDAAGNPLSTFSIDVDTASYANVRRFLNSGRRPPRDAVRIEEMVNYFPYRYAAPKDDAPFAAALEVAAAPWNPQHRLVRIGLKGREVSDARRPALNLVFLLDVSGSMQSAQKLPLVKEAMRLLVDRLKPSDRVAIVTYAGASGLALPSTPASEKKEIIEALDALRAGGTTNGAMGIQLAYDIAKANFVEGGANRVILCTDGDFNVGVTNDGDLTRLIAEKAKSGVFLSVLGFGMGNYKDDKLERLADKGNGNYGYVDDSREARKLLVDQLGGTLVTIAKDVKLQVEFNPALVKSYRLIGYENRLLKTEDFNNDRIDAGEIGAGHTVTALYEVVPAGVDDAPGAAPAVDPLKYSQPAKPAKGATASGEMLTLKVRYKAPDGQVSSKLEFPLVDIGAAFAAASEDFKFAAAVAGFGMVLRDSPHKGSANLETVAGWAESGTSDDAGGYRRDFIALVRKARETNG